MAVFHEDFDGIVLIHRGAVKNHMCAIKNPFYLDGMITSKRKRMKWASLISS